MKKVYIANLPPDMDDDKFRALAEQHVQVVTAHIAKDYEANVSRGFGLVEVQTDAEADKLVSKLGVMTLAGQSLIARKIIPHPVPPKSF